MGLSLKYGGSVRKASSKKPCTWVGIKKGTSWIVREKALDDLLFFDNEHVLGEFKGALAAYKKLEIAIYTLLSNSKKPGDVVLVQASKRERALIDANDRAQDYIDQLEKDNAALKDKLACYEAQPHKKPYPWEEKTPSMEEMWEQLRKAGVVNGDLKVDFSDLEQQLQSLINERGG
jgi:hypothetical protein